MLQIDKEYTCICLLFILLTILTQVVLLHEKDPDYTVNVQLHKHTHMQKGNLISRVTSGIQMHMLMAVHELLK